MSPRATFLIALAFACAPAPPAPPAELAKPIIGGSFDDGDPAVVGIIEQNGQLVCTGTLVSTHAIVSAAHCVTLATPRYVFFGSDLNGDGQYVDVANTHGYPGFDFDTLEGDVSVIIMADPAPAFAGEPVPLPSAAPTMGATARFVGFGFTEIGPSGDYGLKYERTAEITVIEPVTFRYGVATCNGDSGGPAFLMEGGREVLAGVTSWGDPNCSEFGVDTRIDSYVDWITPYLDDIDPASCQGDGRCATGCPDADPDCPCATDGHCSVLCEQPGTDPDCPASCAAEGTCDETCPRRDDDCPVTPLGEDCDRDFECGDGVCDEVCLGRCDLAAPVCAEDHECEMLESGASACVSSGGGCAAAPGRSAGGAISLLLLLTVVVMARKRGTR